MKGSSRLAWAAALALVLSGCALVPPEPVVTGPLTAPPPPPALPAAEANGSIYQPTAYGNYPLFEDRRPRNVGDIVTIVIQEKTNAAKNVNTTTDRSGTASMGIGLAPAILPTDLGAKQNFDATGGNQSKGTGSSSATNVFTGTLTTTVIGVLPNGNLQIAGEKQIAINRGSEYVRFSGVVDPRSITGSNTGVFHPGGRRPHRIPQQGRDGRGPDHGLAAALLPQHRPVLTPWPHR
ncbi:Flagellar L-ring protein OS=Castellaniella sp OX=1955812 GN=flgH PE=3 SV=1 [Castellaniella denitrificans]